MARRLAHEGGWSVAELLAAMVISLIIGSAALFMIQGARDSSLKTTARQEAVTETEAAFDRLTREVRGALLVMWRSSSQLDLKVRVPVANGSSQVRWIKYDCSQDQPGAPAGVKQCTRRDCGVIAEAGSLVGATCSSGTPVRVLQGVQSVSFGVSKDGTTLSPAPQTETPSFDFVSFDARVYLDQKGAGRERYANLRPIQISGGVRVENANL
jgi:hypothetical protein